MVEHTEESWKYMRTFIRNNNIEVYECREAELFNRDGSIDCDLYYLCCRSSIWKFIKFKTKHKYKISFDEMAISLW